MLTNDELTNLSKKIVEMWESADQQSGCDNRKPTSYCFAKAHLREHPPGDELPFTDEWFASFFPNHSAMNALGMAMAYKSERSGLSVWFLANLSMQCTFTVLLGTTRGDVRQFLAWQGIVLK